ncbi:MAG: NifB/NifX family molybdenum-iron cluster-binding protein [Candidatus Saccharimonadaceae bacterium]
MKVAIASNGNTLDSYIDNSFGRCAWFILYDTENGAMEFIPNPNKDMEEHAGQASVELVTSRNVTVIISGEFGIKIKPLLDSMHVQMIVIKDATKRINDIIELLNNRRK